MNKSGVQHPHRVLALVSKYFTFFLLVFCFACNDNHQVQDEFTQWVNPFIGTEPLTDTSIIGYTPPEGWRVWAGLVFPGASLPNAMVQLSPVTEFGSGAGYQYEDSVIIAFTHTNKGHWNLCNIPILPVTGKVDHEHIGSRFDHESETAAPGYYQVLLEDYNINVELTTTLRSGFHRYHFPEDSEKKIVFNLAKSNDRVEDWHIEQAGENVVSGYQDTGNKVFFYAVLNQRIEHFQKGSKEGSPLSVIRLDPEAGNTVELKIGLSYVSAQNALENLQHEIGDKSFEAVKNEADRIWENLLAQIQVSGGTDKEKELFYTSLYRSFLWPVLRSDYNGEYRDAKGNVVRADFDYYTKPSFWDTYRNKLVLLEILSPELTTDIIKSIVDVGEKTGFIPTFFHGDHAAAFIAGAYLRGIDNFDVRKTYKLLLRNATVEGGTRPYITEYMEKGYISTPEVEHPHVETNAKAAVTKTLEYAYDDYAIALIADRLNDTLTYKKFMERSQNYRNLFDVATGFMRGRLEDGQWVENFNPQYPYYEYMYREANAWQSTFFVPHDVEGLIDLFGGAVPFERKLDSLFSIPWNSEYIARNVCCFIGQYSQGNQPDHNYPYLYYFVGKQKKTQKILNKIMDRFYGAGEHGLALSGMDDAGEMSAWYVFNAMGFYPFSPADDDYLITVPIFDEIRLKLKNNNTFYIHKENQGKEINAISLNEDELKGFKLLHSQLIKGGHLTISTIDK